MSSSRGYIGQHHDQSGAAVNSGQKNIRGTAGDIGMPSGGELNNGAAPGAPADSMINRTHYDPSREAGEPHDPAATAREHAARNERHERRR